MTDDMDRVLLVTEIDHLRSEITRLQSELTQLRAECGELRKRNERALRHAFLAGHNAVMNNMDVSIDRAWLEYRALRPSTPAEQRVARDYIQEVADWMGWYVMWESHIPKLAREAIERRLQSYSQDTAEQRETP